MDCRNAVPSTNLLIDRSSGLIGTLRRAFAPGD